ncbi:hypothetical protein [Microvirga mediterraneensis]|uniref:Cadherin domain-containing protein n=1 Tax=Microvirga mediterraneensis TaxID=2754695 RepID=A0A838BM83_9HYPH|nr:hypothetical protein [Microvirga mediterraneensis]MBA1156205.1 hypothetical protein [Microvirga mediterraneensis]
MPTPEIQNLDYILREPNTEVLIDRDQNVIVVAGEHPFQYLDIIAWGPEALFGVRTGSGQVELPQGLGVGKPVVVAGTEIGTISYVNGAGIGFEFTGAATEALVRTLIQSLTYKDLSGYDGFTTSRGIDVYLTDAEGQLAVESVSIGDNVMGTDLDDTLTGGNDTFSANRDLIGAGDSLNGGGGNDELILTGGGFFDLYRMVGLEGVETIKGTADVDYVTIRADQLADVVAINGQGGDDNLFIQGSAIDLTGKVISSFDIHLMTNGATITVGNLETARLVHGYDTSNDKLVIDTGMVSAADLLFLHRQGIDRIVAHDLNGQLVESVHNAPSLLRFGETAITAAVGATVFLDTGQDATLSVDSGLLKSLLIGADQSSDSAAIGVDQSSDVTLSEEGPGHAVFVSGVKIGHVSGIGSHGASFTFNDQATTERVQSLIHALTFSSPSGGEAGTHIVRMSLRDVGNRELKTQLTVTLTPGENPDNPNEAPTGLTLTGASIREASATGMKVGDLSATDAAGTVLTYTLLDNAGGRFAIGADGKSIVVANGTLLDYEQAQSHVIKVQVSDGGLATTKEFTVQVSDVDEVPAHLSLTGASAREAAATGTKVGDLSAVDPEGKALVYTLLDDAGGRFAIGQDGKSIVVANGTLLDFEQTRSHVVKVQVSDGILKSVKEFTIQVNDWIGETVTGTPGHDILVGGSGNDVFVGGLGNDKLNGGAGNDALYGGAGSDIFVFDVKPHKKANHDIVKDYNVKQDAIYLDNAVFTKLGLGSASLPKMLKAKHFKLSSQQQDKDDYIIYNKGTGVLYYDANGSVAGGRTEIAKFSNKPLLKVSEFFVI